MEKAKPIKAVLFDLGETLLVFGKLRLARIFKESARNSYDFLVKNGCVVGSFASYCFTNLSVLRARMMWSAFTGNDFDSLELLKRINRRVRLAPEQWEEFSWRWYEPLAKYGAVEPDIRDTLDGLRNSGLKLGILSNTFIHAPTLERHLDQFEMKDFFDVRLYSYQYHRRKPHHSIFRWAADEMKTPLENIMFVGDRVDNDIKPTLELGMPAAIITAYTNLGVPCPAAAYRIEKLAELPALIKKLNEALQ